MKALHCRVAYRDDNEALQARVEGLQEELATAKATIEHLQGVADFPRPERLPSRPRGFKSRRRTIEGTIDPAVYERITQVLQNHDDAMDTNLVDGMFTAKSKSLHVTVLPEGDEVLMIFDEPSLANYFTAIAVFVSFSGAALGATEDNMPAWALFMSVCGVVWTGLAIKSARRRFDEVEGERNELFATLGGLLERSATKVRVAEPKEVSAAAEDHAPVADEAPPVESAER